MWLGKGQLTANALVALLIGQQDCGKTYFYCFENRRTHTGM